MEKPVKSIGIAALISILGCLGVRELPQHLRHLDNSDWMLILLGALSLTVYLLTNTYLMSRHIAKRSQVH